MTDIKTTSLLNQDYIVTELDKLNLSKYHVQILPKVESTNSYMMERLSSLPDFMVVTAEEQIQGRGRYDKTWSSNKGVDLTSSILFKLPLDYNYTLLPLMVALAVNRQQKEFGITTYIKWPNDIFLANCSKIAGILLESRVIGDVRHIVVGIGLNNINFNNRNDLLVSMIHNINAVFDTYNEADYDSLSKELLLNCIHYQKTIAIYQNDKLIAHGKHVDFASNGAVIVKNDSKINTFSSGSIRFEVDNLAAVP